MRGVCGLAVVLLLLSAAGAQEAGRSESRNGHRSLPADNPALPLPSAKPATRQSSEAAADTKGHWWTSLGSLGLVLVLIILVGRLFQSRGRSGSLPRGIVEVIGRCPLDARQSLYVVRWGSRLLLIGGGPNGAHRLGELSDMEEVERVLALCESRSRRSLSCRLPGVACETPQPSRPPMPGVTGREAT